MSNLALIKSKINIWRRDLRWAIQKLYVLLPFYLSKQYPDFLCIGAPKSATTWLHTRLGLHSDVFLPEDKELHFIDTPYAGSGVEPNVKALGYYKPYDLSLDRCWRWYAFQFKKGEKQIKGDITPTYARASSENIAAVVRKIPDIKIIYILRNPIERAWSGASYFMYRWYGKGMNELENSDEVRSWLLDPERLDHGFYTEKIDVWESHIKNENILYIFYDDIRTNPGAVLKKTCRFLGVSEDGLADSLGDSKKINSGYPKFKISKELWGDLYDIYEDEINRIEKKFSRDLSEWKKPES